MMGGLIGSLIGGGVQAGMRRRAATRQRNWSERMSNTALQRYRADALAAGLNPILGLSKGGASTPSTTAEPVDDITNKAINSARQGKMLKQQLTNMRKDEVIKDNQIVSEYARADELRASEVLKLNQAREAEQRTWTEFAKEDIYAAQFAREKIALEQMLLSLPALRNQAAIEQMLGMEHRLFQMGVSGVRDLAGLIPNKFMKPRGGRGRPPFSKSAKDLIKGKGPLAPGVELPNKAPRGRVYDLPEFRDPTSGRKIKPWDGRGTIPF